jgi:hypothetical protein
LLQCIATDFMWLENHGRPLMYHDDPWCTYKIL